MLWFGYRPRNHPITRTGPRKPQCFSLHFSTGRWGVCEITCNTRCKSKAPLFIYKRILQISNLRYFDNNIDPQNHAYQPQAPSFFRVSFHCKYLRLWNMAPASCPGFQHSISSECRPSMLHCLWHRCILSLLVSAYVMWSGCRLYGLHNKQKNIRCVPATGAILTRCRAGTLVRVITLHS